MSRSQIDKVESHATTLFVRRCLAAIRIRNDFIYNAYYVSASQRKPNTCRLLNESLIRVGFSTNMHEFGVTGWLLPPTEKNDFKIKRSFLRHLILLIRVGGDETRKFKSITLTVHVYRVRRVMCLLTFIMIHRIIDARPSILMGGEIACRQVMLFSLC
jgi:hypothetical protein